MAGTAIMAAAVAGALYFLGTSEDHLLAGVAGIVASSLIWLPATRRWTARAHLCWASSVFLFVVYLAFALDWTFISHMGPASTAGGVVLWLLEVLAAALACAYLWEICDELGSEHWRRRVTPAVTFSAPDEDLPFVSLHVPAHNEPPDMVIATLNALLGLVEPGFLRRCAPAFLDPWIGFLQAPQDYRDWEYAPYYRRLYYSYKYFFAVSQPSRNERDGAIFAGTMGLIRREALDQLGGWDEWCITEDAELSLRLLRAGWSGLHVDQSWGRGIMPLTFEALKGQRYRWCYGGIQILRMHWRSLLPGRTRRRNRLAPAQRWAYLAGAVQWYGDLLSLIFFLFLLAGAGNLAAGGGELFRKLTPFLVGTVPVLVGLGLVRAVALLRRGTGASWREAIGAFFIWQSTSLIVARASLLALFASKAAFLRTPKTSERVRWWEALRTNWAESALAVMGLAGIAAALSRASQLSGPLLAALLVFPTLGMAAAPANSWAAQRAALPRWLLERRHMRRDRRGGPDGKRHVTAAGGELVPGLL
jgi:Glycosyl transferase family group 2